MSGPPTDEALRERCRALLVVADLQTMTAKSLRRQLSDEFGCELKEQKGVINEEIASFLATHSKQNDVDAAEPVPTPAEVPPVQQQPPCSPAALALLCMVSRVNPSPLWS